MIRVPHPRPANATTNRPVTHPSLDALSAFDADHDGLLPGEELDGLALWRDLNGNGRVEPGEVQPLQACGIVALSCHATPHARGFLFNPQGASFADGSTRATYDWISTSPAASRMPP